MRIEVEGINTLWLPSRTSNRTCTLNLNHSITGFDENGQLWGENGNCGTSYKVIEVPDSVTESDLERIGIAVNEACGNSFPVWYNAMRASNVDVVKKVISEMFEMTAANGIA
jgi:hypothetical protein